MKQAILTRTDLELPKGKLAVQVAHASVEAVLKSSKSDVEEWRSGGAKKVVLKVANEKELHDFQKKAQTAKLRSALITDAGLTVVAPGTITALAIGPADDIALDKIVGHLKLL